MFPLVHYFVNSEIAAKTGKTVPRLTALGGLWPDLAANAGCSRDEAHMMGAAFHAWCLAQAPEGRDLARGIISHGSAPPCVDYYADEAWPDTPDYPKGWCFLQGEAYRDAVAAATRLPERMIWWKAHNFVEMSYELLTDAAHPDLKLELLAAIHDEEAVNTAARLLAAYTGKPAGVIAGCFRHAPDTFAIATVSADELAQKQCLSFVMRHRHCDGDAAAMAALLLRMRDELAADYPAFLAVAVARTAEILAKY